MSKKFRAFLKVLLREILEQVAAEAIAELEASTPSTPTS